MTGANLVLKHGLVFEDLYRRDGLGARPLSLGEVDRLIAIGSDAMMGAVARAARGARALPKPGHTAIDSINSPMQCMMKEICTQCLQLHKDPATGEETVVLSCFNQDQRPDAVDFRRLNDCLRQNVTEEKLTKLWIEHCFKQVGWRAPAATE